MPEVAVSQVIDVPVEEAWDRVRHFASIGEWHPLIEESYIEDDGPGDRLGVVRNLLAEGEHHRDRLQEMSDLNHYYKYTLVDAPLPVDNYVATFGLIEISEGDRCRAEWSCRFDVAPEDRVDVVSMLEEVFRDGMNSLKEYLE